MATGLSGLLALVQTKILIGGRRTTGGNVQAVFNLGFQSTLNIADGGLVVEKLTGYTTELTPTDDKHWTPKKWVLDQIASSVPSGVILANGTVPMAATLNLAGNDINRVQSIRDTSSVLSISPSTRILYDNTGAAILSYQTKTNGVGIITNSWGGFIKMDNLTTVRTYQFPDASGTIALSSDLSSYLPLAGGVISGAVTFSALTADTVPYIDASKNFVSSSITPTELGYLSGATSNLQNQINNINAGLSWKPAVRVATTVNITLSGTQTIDGISVIEGDRVLVKNQSTSSQNGIYVCAAGTWSRSTDSDTGSEILQATVSIEEGSVNADTIYTCTTDAPITIGSTSIVFAKTSATTYTGSDGISLIGNNFTLDNTYFTGQATLSAGVVTLLNSAVIGKVLTGYVSGAGTVSSTDTILQAIQKLNGNFNALSASNGINLTSSVFSLKASLNQDSTGFISYLSQTSGTVATPASGFNLYADSTNRFSWKGANGYIRTFDGISNTANRAYVLPNQPGQISINTGYVGVRLDDYFDRASIGSSYTQLGSTATFGITSNLLTVSGGASNYNEALYLNQSSNSEESTFSIEINQNVSAGKIGVGVVNVAGNEGFLVDIDLTAGGTRGQLTIKSRISASTTVRSTSTVNLSFLDSDTIVLKIVLSKFTLSAYAYLKNTPTTKVIAPPVDSGALSSTWTVARIWNPCIYAHSGSQKISNFKWEGNENKGPLIAIQSDSEFKGYGNTNVTDRVASLWNDNLGGYNNVVVFSSGGNRVANLTSCINDLDVSLPKYAFVNIGINNARDAQVLASFQTDFNAYLALLEARGITPILSTIAPVGTSYASSSAVNTLVVSYNTWISSLSTKYKVIDIYTALSSAGVLNTLYDSGDFIHWNSYGNQIVWQTILAGTSDLFKYSNNISNLYNRLNVNLGADNLYYTYSKNAALFLGASNSNSGSSASAALLALGDVANTRIIQYSSTNSTDANRGVLYNSHVGLDIYAGGASGIIRFKTGGDNVRGNITSGGLWRIGDNTTPTALLHLAAGTATAGTAPLKFTSGTNLSTIENGAVEYNGTNLFYSSSGVRNTIATINLAQTFSGLQAFSNSTGLFISQANNNATNRGFYLTTRDVTGLTYPVPALYPSTANSLGVLDVMPNGSPTENAVRGMAWFDVCNSDVLNSNSPTLNTVGLGAHSTFLELIFARYNGASALPIKFTQSGAGGASPVPFFYYDPSLGNTRMGWGLGAVIPTQTYHFHEATAATSCVIKITNDNSGTTATDGLDIFIDASGNAGLLNRENAQMKFYTNATQRVTISAAGGTFFGGSTTATALVHLAAGTSAASTAPLKFTSGTNLTTAEVGSLEYNGINLFFTRVGTTRENIVCSSAVNSVSPTAPNRTIAVNIDGTTYYIAAKTTND
jgi:hypothetical protein